MNEDNKTGIVIFIVILIIILIIVAIIFFVYEEENKSIETRLIAAIPARIVTDVIPLPPVGADDVLIDPNSTTSFLFKGDLLRGNITSQTYGRFREGIIVDSTTVQQTESGDILYIHVPNVNISGIYRLETFSTIPSWTLYVSTGSNTSIAIIDGRIILDSNDITDIVWRDDRLFLTTSERIFTAQENSIKVLTDDVSDAVGSDIVEMLMEDESSEDSLTIPNNDRILYMKCTMDILVSENGNFNIINTSRNQKEIVPAFVKYINSDYYVYVLPNGGYTIVSLTSRDNGSKRTDRIIAFNTTLSGWINYITMNGISHGFKYDLSMGVRNQINNLDIIYGQIPNININTFENTFITTAVGQRDFYTVSIPSNRVVNNHWYCT